MQLSTKRAARRLGLFLLLGLLVAGIWGTGLVGNGSARSALALSSAISPSYRWGQVGSSSSTNTIINAAVQPAGSLVAWGENYSGQLGSGTNITGSTSAVLVNLPPGVTATKIASGSEHTLAIGSDSKLYAWGLNNDGQLGNNTITQSNTPIVVNLPIGVTALAVAAGQYHSMALGSDGKLYEWGRNDSGQLGNGTTTNSATPVVVNLPAGVGATVITAGYYHSLAIGNDGKLYAWGDNYFGQLGNGTTISSSTPVVVNLPAGVTPTAIAAGYLHSLAIGSDGNLYSWGINSAGQLGNGTNIPIVPPR